MNSKQIIILLHVLGSLQTTAQVNNNAINYSVYSEAEYLKVIQEEIKQDPVLSFKESVGSALQLKRLKKYLPKDAVLLNFFYGTENLFTVCATSEKVVVFKQQYTDKQLAKDCAILSKSIIKSSRYAHRGVIDDTPYKKIMGDKGGSDTMDYQTMASYLAGRLIKPAETLLAGKKHLYIIAEGALKKIPFCMLPVTGQLGEVLNDKLSITLLSVSPDNDLGSKTMPLKNIDIVAFANPDGSLPGAEAEVKAIKTVMRSARVFIGKGMLRDSIFKNLNDKNIIHFATHGFVDVNDIRNSYLLIKSDQQGNKLLFDDLGKALTNRLDLMVLSACNTGVITEGGLSVSPTDMLYKYGVSRIIAALWAIDDKATEILMTDFYKNLINYGVSESLRLAQNKLKKIEKYSHPYFWSGLFLFGAAN